VKRERVPQILMKSRGQLGNILKVYTQIN
jgi:hypothetical protein